MTTKFPDGLVLRDGHDEESLGDDDPAQVKENVVVRTEAQNVLHDVGPVVWLAEGPDVGRFAVGTSARLEANTADLAPMVVNRLVLVWLLGPNERPLDDLRSEPCIGPIGLEEDIVVTPDAVQFLVPPQRALYLI
ncbi:MAG TPA: hypothetical protein VGR16_06660 [Thermomicrobiales bacterium]|nr:hypothetical protein [Thermomicrobiales bacterium]